MFSFEKSVSVFEKSMHDIDATIEISEKLRKTEKVQHIQHRLCVAVAEYLGTVSVEIGPEYHKEMKRLHGQMLSLALFVRNFVNNLDKNDALPVSVRDVFIRMIEELEDTASDIELYSEADYFVKPMSELPKI